MRKFFFILIFLDLVLIIYFLLNKDYLYLLNTQIAFIASILITTGSFLGYKKMVLKKAKEYKNSDNLDLIDKIDDPYDLYSQNLDEIDAKELFDEEKKRVKGFKKGIENFLLTSSAFFSIYRVFGYIFLIVSILFLMDKKIFSPLYFFIGLSIVPFSAIVFTLKR